MHTEKRNRLFCFIMVKDQSITAFGIEGQNSPPVTFVVGQIFTTAPVST